MTKFIYTPYELMNFNPNLGKHLGDAHELAGCIWLLNRGLDAFRNVSKHGPVDIIGLDPNTLEIYLYNVKTDGRGSGNNNHGPSFSSKEHPKLRFLIVDPHNARIREAINECPS